MKRATPAQVKHLRRIKKKLSNTKLKEEIFTGKDSKNWVIDGHAILEAQVDSPLACAMLCIRCNATCKSFNYEDITTADGHIDPNVNKTCVLNSVNAVEDRGSLVEKMGFKLFDLELFFV